MNKRMPIGVDDFREVREKYYFVDKTFFIKDLIEERGKVTLLTRPRRFGKTLTMSLLKYFFEIDHAEENRKLFHGLSIEEAGQKYMKEQGKYPVVMLTLKDTKQEQWESMLARMRSIANDLYSQHNYLLESQRLDDNDKLYFHKVLCGKVAQEELELSLRKLTYFLHKHYDKQAIILLDEYDVPVQQAWENKFYQPMIGFMKNFMGAALKNNNSLDFAVLTGVLRISKESIFSDLNNLDVCSVMTEKYNNALGFATDEVKRIAVDFGIEDKFPELKEWYDGYNFAGKEMYNPWSVVKYVDAKCKPQAYWLNTSGNALLRHVLEKNRRDDERNLLALMEGKSIVSSVREGVIYTDIQNDKDALYTMLVTTGYLKVVEEKSSDGLSSLCTLAIPNREIRAAYRFEVLDKMRRGLEISDLLMLMENLLAGETEAFEEGLQRYLLELVSVYDAANKESFYHGLMLGMTALLIPTYQVRSNRESGYGRFDLAIFPNDSNKNGVILEFKAMEREELLESQAKRALVQIEEKSYITEFQKFGVKNVLKYGIAFCGKRLKILRA